MKQYKTSISDDELVKVAGGRKMLEKDSASFWRTERCPGPILGNYYNCKGCSDLTIEQSGVGFKCKRLN
ncbi:MAG: hypothetical protein ACERKN_16075 [Velocimicrobium sp.]